MAGIKDRDWEKFEKTGRIDAYLRFRERRREAEMRKYGFEVGEEFGIGENRRDCHKDDEIW